ncbi:MAG: 2'-5' RNA ligase family protein, partial [Propionibacteriaceae bacterium]|nr:2'-5' RNA ligase family protein [Propionibacteriaceae bacterium]
MPFTHTIACQDRDFPEWHGGRSHALVWALELDGPDVREAVAEARARLDGLVLPRYERQPHVTVAFAGLAAQEGLTGYDDEQLQADLTRLRPLVDGAVELRATGWGTFPMVPYLAVESPWLAEAHRVLDDGVGAAHGMPYLPHLTLGHWRGQWRRHEVLERLDAPLPTGRWIVGELSLLRYET